MEPDPTQVWERLGKERPGGEGRAGEERVHSYVHSQEGEAHGRGVGVSGLGPAWMAVAAGPAVRKQSRTHGRRESE